MKERDFMPSAEQLGAKRMELNDGTPVEVHVIQDKLQWGEGAIEAPDYNERQIENITQAAIKSITQVPKDLLMKSGCTDGRGRISWLDGSKAEVLQKLVGTDLMTGLAIAEGLGQRFYGKNIDKPIMDRIGIVADYLQQNNITLTTHEGCGARVAYDAIEKNAIRFNSDIKEYAVRTQEIIPDVTSSSISEVLKEWSQRDNSGYDAEAVRKLVIDRTGPKGSKMLHEEHDKTHGHKEIAIARLNLRGKALSARTFIEEMNNSDDELLAGSQIFSVNDDRIIDLARLFADNEQQYYLALTAAALFTDAGHATLAKNLPTIYITAA